MTRYLPADAANRALDRVLQVEGTIEGIRKAEDFTVLGGIKKELVVDFYVGQLGHQSLTCHFSKKNHAQLARLSKGQYHCRGGGVQRGGIWECLTPRLPDHQPMSEERGLSGGGKPGTATGSWGAPFG